MARKTVQKNGFSLIELVVVMAILAVLAGLAILMVPKLVDRARAATDDYNISVLNTATQHYLFNAASPNPFEIDTETTVSRMDALIDAGYLSETISPQQKNKSFSWSMVGRTWLLAATTEEADSTELNNHSSSESTTNGSENQNQTTTTAEIGEFILGSGSSASLIAAYTGSDTIITIPDTIQGITVTGITGSVFQSKGLTEVTFPTSLTQIAAKAFIGNNISKITIGANVTIADQAFSGNDKFREAYTAAGNVAGTYVLDKNSWVKQ